MAQIFANAARAVLAAGIASGDTTVTIVSGGSLFPVVASPDFARAVLQDANGIEIVLITAHTANATSFTVTRAQEGTTARSFDAGSVFGIRVTAADMDVAVSVTPAGSQTLTNKTFGDNPTFSAGTANAVAFLNGSKVLTTGSALTFDGTNLGVGTSSAAYKLTVYNGSAVFQNAETGTGTDNGFFVGNASASTAYVWNFENFPTLFGINNTEQMRLTSTGLGIGTSSPQTKLHVVSTSTTATIESTSGPVYVRFAAPSGVNNGYIGYGDGGAENMTFWTAGNERMRLNASGNLGLGVTPSAWSLYKAFQNGSTSVADFNSGNNSIYGSNVYYGGSPTDFRYVSTGSAATMYRQVDGAHTWSTTGAVTGTAGSVATLTQAMTLDASGNLNITSPANTDSILTVNSTSTNVSRRISLSSNGTVGTQLYDDADQTILSAFTAKPLVFRTTNTERARITSGGDLCVGSTSAGNAGSINVSVGNPGTTVGGLQLWSTTSATHYVHFGDGASGADPYRGYVGYAHASDALLFGTAATERARITSGGQFVIGSSGAVTSLASGTLQVGSGISGLTPGTIPTAIVTSGALEFNFDGVSGTQRHGRIVGTAGSGVGGAYGGGLNLEYYAYDNVSTYQWYTGLSLDAEGNVGIGTSSPIQRLDVASSNTAVYQAIRSTSSGATNVALLIQDGTTGFNNGDGIYLGRTGAVNYLWTYENEPWVFATNNTERARISSAGGFMVGTTTDPGAGLIADSMGNVRAIPPSGTRTSSYTLVKADVGDYVQVGSGGSITIPNAVFAEGDVVSVFNNTSGTVTITCSITTAYIGGADADKATMTLAARGVATILFISGTVCVVNGNVA